jgi:hypothetical protein
LLVCVEAHGSGCFHLPFPESGGGSIQFAARPGRI